SETDCWLCPMIDARRMEVFTAIFDQELREILPSTNLILSSESFHAYLQEQMICFFGNGSNKFKSLIIHPRAQFISVDAGARDMVKLALDKHFRAEFASLAYTEPFYGKDFHSLTK